MSSKVNSQPNQRPLIRPRPSATRSITRNGRSRCASLNRRLSTMRPRSNSCSCLSFPPPPILFRVHILDAVDQRHTRKTRRRWRTSTLRTERRCSRTPSCRILSSGRSRRVVQRRQKKVRAVWSAHETENSRRVVTAVDPHF